MRFLFFFLFTITVSAQVNTKNIFANRAPCEFEMSKEELMTKNISFHCNTLFGNTSFEIENFKLKIKNNSSIHIKSFYKIGSIFHLKSLTFNKISNKSVIFIFFMNFLNMLNIFN